MAKSNTVYQLTITLAEIKPPIWRRVQVKDCSLSKLHEVIQAAMGWTNTHLWAFDIDGVDYGDDLEDEVDLSSARKAKLGDFVAEGVKKFRYIYDFGDNWEHIVQVEKVLSADATAEYPRCVGGQRARPPEDCGGPWGYGDLLEAIKNPGKNPELLEWVGGEFDPERFDLAAVNEELAAVR
jgi:Plasmid pRiA4b ORF-3-like protein